MAHAELIMRVGSGPDLGTYAAACTQLASGKLGFEVLNPNGRVVRVAGRTFVEASSQNQRRR
jgi:hypothetical protein